MAGSAILERSSVRFGPVALFGTRFGLSCRCRASARSFTRVETRGGTWDASCSGMLLRGSHLSLLTVAVGFVVIACGEPETPRDGGGGAGGGAGASAGVFGAGNAGAGTGGTAGVGGGTAGNSGTGGTGGMGLPDDWADCLLDLLARCPLVGSCLESTAGDLTETCYSDGTRTESEEALSGSCAPDQVVRVYGPDGSLCYASTATRGLGCEAPSTTWRDGDGNVVAVSSGPSAWAPTPYAFTCTGAETIRFEDAPPLLVPGAPSCEPGSCRTGEGGMGGAP